MQNMNEPWLPKVVLYWDFMSGSKGWPSDLCLIMSQLGMVTPSMDLPAYDLDTMQSFIKEKSRFEWKIEAHAKPKLRT